MFFHQVEGLYIDKEVTFADLLATMQEFFKNCSNVKLKHAFVPAIFPLSNLAWKSIWDASLAQVKAVPYASIPAGLKLRVQAWFIRKCLKNGGIDPEIYSGFAWGMGVERMILLKYGVKDIRMFTENDLRFLDQFTHF